jgi:hypothetical protein
MAAGEPAVTMQGWLEKSSAGKLKRVATKKGHQIAPVRTLGNVFAKWDRRFFLLRGPTLAWYKGPGDPAPAGCVEVAGHTVEEMGAGSMSIGIFTDERTLVVRPAAREYASLGSSIVEDRMRADMRAWLRALVRAGARYPGVLDEHDTAEQVGIWPTPGLRPHSRAGRTSQGPAAASGEPPAGKPDALPEGLVARLLAAFGCCACCLAQSTQPYQPARKQPAEEEEEPVLI